MGVANVKPYLSAIRFISSGSAPFWIHSLISCLKFSKCWMKFFGLAFVASIFLCIISLRLQRYTSFFEMSLFFNTKLSQMGQ